LASSDDDPELVIKRSHLLEIRREVRELRELLVARRRERERLAFNCKLAAARFESAFLRYGQMLRKAGFNPDQPRVPEGNSDGGQWTSEGGAAGGQNDRLAARRRPGAEAECDAQLKRDTVICNLVRTPLCWAQAMERYSSCLSGRPIPQLRF
jgi:hypothetical protein